MKFIYDDKGDLIKVIYAPWENEEEAKGLVESVVRFNKRSREIKAETERELAKIKDRYNREMAKILGSKIDNSDDIKASKIRFLTKYRRKQNEIFETICKNLNIDPSEIKV